MNILKFVLIAMISIVVSTSLFAQPQADFTANVTEGCGSLQVSFQNLSQGNVISYSWDLGGVNSTTADPGRVFGTPGRYDICLTVTNASGQSDTECKTEYITVFELPEPDFSVPNVNGCLPYDVAFTDLSTSQDGNIVEWIWGLGGVEGVVVDDGTLPGITNQYEAIDEYTVSLTVKDDNGCSNTITKENYIIVHDDPVIDFTADQPFSCTSPHTVNFLNTTANQEMIFQWDFGNGQVFNGASPAPVSYNNQGQYDVELNVRDTITGCVDTLRKANFVQISYPTSYETSSDTVCIGEELQFTDTSPDAAVSVYWDFGDGDNSTEANPVHVYDTPGCYNIIFTRSVNGCPGVVVSDQCIRVLDKSPVEIISDNKLGCSIHHEVNFSTDAMPGTTMEWNFGDGAAANGLTPTHSFDTTGVYVVELKATNPAGCTTISYDTIKVLPAQAIITSELKDGCTPLTFQVNQASESFGEITSWEWEVRNDVSSPPIVFSANDTFPEFTIVDTGRYDIHLIVKDNLGCSDTTVFEGGAAVGIPPEVNFSAEPTISCINATVTFTDESSDYTTDWFWEFGDDGTAIDENPTYVYADTGKMDVRLIAIHNGCPAELTKTEFIEVMPPKAGFEIERICDQLYIIDFVDKTIGADSVLYDFGVPNIETDTSTSYAPQWTYTETGDYMVTQVVFNFTTGCSDTTEQLVQITEPKASFLLSTLTGCAPLTIQLADSSAFANAWEWTADSRATISDPAAAEPTITFDQSGFYTDIQLLVTDVNGCQDSIPLRDTIFVNEVLPDFSVTDSIGCYPFTTSFVDASTSVYGDLAEWEWSFGDGNNQSNLLTPEHTYNDAGYFDVTLTVKDDWGCTKTLTQDSLVEVTRPIADFTTKDTLSCSTNIVIFENKSTGKGITWHWDFGDGNTSTDEHPEHLYPVEDEYTVCLTVTDEYGCENTLCKNNYVKVADPVAALTQDKTIGICPPLLVNFENLSSNASAYTWDFGDDSGTSEQEHPSHIYTLPGIYDLTLVATRTEACQDTLILEEHITLNGPIGSFSFDIDTACAPASINFIGHSNKPYRFIWDFGDGMLDTTDAVTYDSIFYQYERGGNFLPQLILIDEADCRSTLIAENPIVISSMKVDFQADRTSFCDDQGTTRFSNLTSSTHPITELEWTFSGITPEKTTLPEPQILYENSGNYDVKLMVQNGICIDSLLKESYIGVGAVPVAAFDLSDTIGCAPFTVNFEDQSTVENSIIEKWNWTFSNTNTADIENPVHIFNDPGIHEIQLMSTSTEGCQDTIYKSVEVLERPAFSIPSPESICKGQAAPLIPEITEDTVGYQFNWVSHPDLSCSDCFKTFAAPQDTTTYTLEITNDLGCSTVETVKVDVRPYEAPVVTLTADTSICLNGVVQLHATGGMTLYEYQWGTDQPGLSCYQDCRNPVASPEVTTEYHVTVTNEYGCATADSVLVTIENEWEPITDQNPIICEGDEVQLQTLIGTHTQWMVTEGLSCTYCSDPVASPDSTVQYFVKVLTAEGCELIDSMTVEVMRQIDIDAGDDLQICNGESIQLNGIGAGEVAWTPANRLSDATMLRPDANPTETTMFTMGITRGSCTLYDSVKVVVEQKTDLMTEDVEICQGETIDLDFEGVVDDYFWMNENGGLLESATVSPRDTATYFVVGSYSTCLPDTAELTVAVTPEPSRWLSDSLYFIPGQSFTITLNTPDTAQYEFDWKPVSYFSCADCQNPKVAPDSNIVYTVDITDLITGCSATDSIRLDPLTTCPPDLIGVPDVFSPNDDGVNDYFKLYPNPSIKSIVSFRIFNRWGAELFATDEMNDPGWDGRVGGKLSPMGVYIYMVEFECELTGQIVVKAGDLTLVR